MLMQDEPSDSPQQDLQGRLPPSLFQPQLSKNSISRRIGMRIGIHLPHIGRKAGPEAIRRAAIQAEELGFADVWTSEHIIIPKGAPYPPSALFYEPVLTLTWAAAFTSRVGLGTSVLVLPMRHPLP
ncbi:MAG: LLM class flavin-dependent oxidoreductase, partial [Alphaproteobacteria bacterium]